MQKVHFYWSFIWNILFIVQGNAFKYVTLSHDGPVVLGGTITFRADLYEENGQRPIGPFIYKWSDDALPHHTYETEETSNTTTYWSISYPRENYSIGRYEVQVIVSANVFPFIWRPVTSARIRFDVNEYLNGNITIIQSNKTLESAYVSTASEANMTINMRTGDLDYIMQKATSVSTYWFIDCKYYGQTNDLSFLYNFTSPNVSHIVEALVIASYDLPTTTTIPPLTTPTTTPISPFGIITINESTSNISNTNLTTVRPLTTMLSATSTKKMKPTTIIAAPVTDKPMINVTSMDIVNISLPYICSNASIIPPDPNKTYGHFTKKINIRDPIMNITVDGTNWIQPWDMLSLNVTCKGSGPFYKCLQFHHGKYNMTGNETCENGDHLQSCNFSIIHYFLEPSVYTILVILNNDVSKQIYPLTINIYKVTTKPQLSVIVVPVSCSLAAVVLIVFGIAYYIQSRARFTVEVADFDFGQSNPEMEYKTFTERLRDSFNNAIRPGSKRISGYTPLSNPETLQ